MNNDNTSASLVKSSVRGFRIANAKRVRVFVHPLHPVWAEGGEAAYACYVCVQHRQKHPSLAGNAAESKAFNTFCHALCAYVLDQCHDRGGGGGHFSAPIVLQTSTLQFELPPPIVVLATIATACLGLLIEIDGKTNIPAQFLPGGKDSLLGKAQLGVRM